MFNLKSVYGVLSFNRSKISILVVEKADSGKTNCLYFNSVDLEYLDAHDNFVDIEKLALEVNKLTRAADKFIGIIVKRYIINVSYLPIRVVRNISEDFIIAPNRILDKNDYFKFMNGINLLDKSSNDVIINVHPYLWKLDGKNLSSFPYGETGNSISFDYVAYITNNDIYQSFKNLAAKCSISILSITNNQIAYCGCLADINNKKKNVVIDIKSNGSAINLYDEHNQLVYFEEISFGSKQMEERLKNIFDISDNQSIIPLMDGLETICNLDSSVSLINTHKQDFLSLKVASAKALSTCVRHIDNKFFEQVNIKLDQIMNQTNLSYDNIYICGNNMALKFINFEHKNYELFKNNIIGIEDKNVSNMLGAVLYVNTCQKNMNHMKYSIDPYVSQSLYNAQLNKNILMQVGRITTKWAAKI